MTEVTQEAIGEVLGGIMASINDEYRQMKKEDLEKHWFFKFNPTKSLTFNIYNFQDCLDLYKGSCRRWEQMHNGSCCVVERVRDEYLIPKIRQFEKEVRDYLNNEKEKQ